MFVDGVWMLRFPRLESDDEDTVGRILETPEVEVLMEGKVSVDDVSEESSRLDAEEARGNEAEPLGGDSRPESRE